MLENKETSTINRQNIKVIRSKKDAQKSDKKHIPQNKSKILDSDTEEIKTNQEWVERAVNQPGPLRAHRRDKEHLNLEIPPINEDRGTLDKEVSVCMGSDGRVVDTRSVGVYFNCNERDSEEIDSETTSPPTYLMPFNPNNIYGLKGDSYFHGMSRTFHAQPIIPEQQDTLIFQSPYKLEQRKKNYK